MASRVKAKKGEAHVRLYSHELECPAYRTLSTDGRALLVEMRSFYTGRENRIFLSIRQIQERLGIGQRPAQRARDELIERGWIRVLEPGAFTRKTRQATTYALTNEPLTNRDGDTAPKDYMRWQPPKRKLTVVKTTTDGSRNDYRGHRDDARNKPDSSQNSYRQRKSRRSTVVKTATQICLPPGCGAEYLGKDVLFWAAAHRATPSEARAILFAHWLALSDGEAKAAA